MRLVVAEDSPLVRSSLVDLLTLEPGKLVVAAICAAPSEGILESVRRHVPDALIYAVPPGHSTHVETVRRTKAAFPQLRILVLYNDPCIACERRCLEEGAEACLDKAIEFHCLPELLDSGPGIAPGSMSCGRRSLNLTRDGR